MTISEKLQEIAKNEQKVYNAGYNKGKAEGGGNSGITPIERAKPIITVSPDGVITAEATQASGYVEAGTEKETKTLKTVNNLIVTPNDKKRVVVQPSTYVIGNGVIVEAIPDTYVKPSGTLDITANGVHNVHGYEEVEVNVTGGGFNEEYINKELDAILAIQEPLLPLTFTFIDEFGAPHTLQFSIAMDWETWCATAYNTVGLIIKNGLLYTSLGAGVKDNTAGIYPVYYTVIEADRTYQAQ